MALNKQEREILAAKGLEVRQAALDVINCEELYDLFPGDGQDDFIICRFGQLLDEKLKELAANLNRRKS